MVDEVKDPLDLSDEDFANLSDEAVEAMFDEPAAADDAAGSDGDSPDGDDKNLAAEDDTNSDDGSDDVDDSDANTDDDSANKGDPANDSDAGDEDAVGDEPNADDVNDKDSKDDKPGSDDDDERNYQAEIEALVAPFRANGKDMQIDNVEEARKLMQMGANYNKKMAAIKPSLRYIKMLENNNLLDEDNLSYLIDLAKKDPAAINKLLKDSGVNPLELDLEKEHGYETKKTYTVSDNEVDLDETLKEIRDTPSFEQTLDIVSNKWDAESKQILVSNPDVIKVINDHVAEGIYDKITQVMDRERMLGNLNGMSDLDAYKYVGDAIHKSGGFDTAGDENHTSDNDKPSKTVDPNVKQRKKAASSTKPTVTKKKKKADFDPLSMSDEDFEKFNADGLFN